MFLRFFDTTRVNALSADMVKAMLRVMPPASLADTSKQGAKRRDKLEERMRRDVERLAAETSFNLFQKAKLGPSLQNHMEAAGYPADFSKDVSFELVKLVAQAAARRTG